MRRIILLGLGSRGDVLPLVCLAAALNREGHASVVLTSDDYENEVRRAGVNFTSIAPGMRFAQSPEVANESQRARFENPLGTAIALRNILRDISNPVADLLQGMVTADDVVLTGVLGASLAAVLKRYRGCSIVNVTFAATVPTAVGAAYVSAPFPHRTSLLNKAASVLAQRAFLSLTMAPGKALATRLGHTLTLRQLEHEFVNSPTLVGASELLAPAAADWPEHVKVTGAWTTEAAETSPLPADLETFLSQGPPPVYIGFGSTVSRDPADELRIFADAARAAGVRIVMRRNDWHSPDDELYGDHTFVTNTVPHATLFPRTAAVIHHGGAGTTYAALRAGVPSSVVWHNLDQPFHGRRSAELGVGPLGFSKRRLTQQRLAELMRGLVSSVETRGYRANATAIAETLSKEHGTTQAVLALKNWGLL